MPEHRAGGGHVIYVGIYMLALTLVLLWNAGAHIEEDE